MCYTYLSESLCLGLKPALSALRYVVVSAKCTKMSLPSCYEKRALSVGRPQIQFQYVAKKLLTDFGLPQPIPSFVIIFHMNIFWVSEYPLFEAPFGGLPSNLPADDRPCLKLLVSTFANSRGLIRAWIWLEVYPLVIKAMESPNE